MFALNRLILIDSYKPGTLQEVRLDEHTKAKNLYLQQRKSLEA